MQTMWQALKISLPITLMTFAIFARTDMVVNPGWLQVAASFLTLTGTCATAFAMFGRFAANRTADIALRVALALLAFVAMLHPDGGVAAVAAAFALPATIYGVWRHRRVASPPAALQPQPAG
jgi:TRAP-type uncharacterized transport system fused permease subunit